MVSRGLALLFLDHGTRRGWGISVTPRPLFTLEKDAVPIVQEAGQAPGPVWTGAENLASTGIPSPDRPVAIPTTLTGPHMLLCCSLYAIYAKKNLSDNTGWRAVDGFSSVLFVRCKHEHEREIFWLIDRSDFLNCSCWRRHVRFWLMWGDSLNQCILSVLHLCIHKGKWDKQHKQLNLSGTNSF